MRGASFLGSFTSGRRSRGRLSDLLEVTINKIRNGEKKPELISDVPMVLSYLCRFQWPKEHMTFANLVDLFCNRDLS